ncbi:MAG: hypothetical protein QOG53_190 [Frankiales bacterium]|jgi:hypothetical protein|nr:hypothetical protein [Frankiales bacterium]
MSRRLILAAGAAAVALTALVFAPPSQAAPRGAECNLGGTATISPGLTATAKTQKVTLKVNLTNCHMGSSGSPGVPKTFTGAVTTAPNPVTSKGSCSNGKFNIQTSIRWSTGTVTNAAITVNTLTADALIHGNVTSSTDPNIKAKDLVAGSAAFRPSNPAQNCASKPVTSVVVNGVVGLGSPK